MTQFQTDRLLLRAPQAADAEHLHQIYGCAETMRYWDSLPDATRAQTTARVAQMMQQTPVRYFVITYEQRAIGAAGFHEGPEIGFILNRKYHRMGMMSEAVTALIRWGFEKLQMPKITADVDPRNQASISFLEAHGFQETGRAKDTFCVGGQMVDSVYFALVPNSR